jgi:ArsR family transcriptional regulator
MNEIEIFKALSNETRLHILEWLRDPASNFPPQGRHLREPVDLKGGVCVGSIRDKAGVSQSTVSHYLDMMQKAGLLLAERHGKWTYYRRNEEVIQSLSVFVGTKL